MDGHGLGIVVLVVCAIGVYSILRWVCTQVKSCAGHRYRIPKQQQKPIEPKRLPVFEELSNHGAHLLAEVQSKKQSCKEEISKQKSVLEKLEVEEIKIKTGIEGESRLDDFLRNWLDDGWTIIAGYRAHNGEIDRILVGPRGVFAFEVKNLGGVIHCDGDRWWRDRADRYGNVVEQNVPIVDNGGRSPSRQINDASDGLQQLLKKNRCGVVVVRVIVFNHPRTVLGNINNLSVNFLIHRPERSIDVEKVLSRGTSLHRDQVQRIATTIRNHHEWFERKEQQTAKIGIPLPSFQSLSCGEGSIMAKVS